LKNFASNFADQ